MTTLRVRSTHPHTQGEYVIIDAEHYDPAVHVLYEGASEPVPSASDAGDDRISSALTNTSITNAQTRKRKA